MGLYKHGNKTNLKRSLHQNNSYFYNDSHRRLSSQCENVEWSFWDTKATIYCRSL